MLDTGGEYGPHYWHTSVAGSLQWLGGILQPASCASFISADMTRQRELLKSPNRQVGDRSLQPTKETRARPSQIPQPGGWGSFIPAYLELPSPCRHMQSLIEHCNLAHIGWNQQSSTPVGRFQKLALARRVGWNEQSPTCRLGDLRGSRPRLLCRLERTIPNLPVGGFADYLPITALPQAQN